MLTRTRSTDTATPEQKSKIGMLASTEIAHDERRRMAVLSATERRDNDSPLPSTSTGTIVRALRNNAVSFALSKSSLAANDARADVNASESASDA